MPNLDLYSNRIVGAYLNYVSAVLIFLNYRYIILNQGDSSPGRL